MATRAPAALIRLGAFTQRTHATRAATKRARKSMMAIGVIAPCGVGWMLLLILTAIAEPFHPHPARGPDGSWPDRRAVYVQRADYDFVFAAPCEFRGVDRSCLGT